MDASYIGKKISESRKQKGMTQKDLAKLLNITDKAVSKWERGLNFPDIALLEQLAAVLQISVAELLGIEDTPSEQAVLDLAAIAQQEKRAIVKELIHYHQLCWWFDFCPIRAHTCAPRRRCLKQLCHQTSKRGPIGYLLSSTLPSVPVCISSLLLP